MNDLVLEEIRVHIVGGYGAQAYEGYSLGGFFNRAKGFIIEAQS